MLRVFLYEGKNIFHSSVSRAVEGPDWTKPLSYPHICGLGLGRVKALITLSSLTILKPLAFPQWLSRAGPPCQRSGLTILSVRVQRMICLCRILPNICIFDQFMTFFFFLFSLFATAFDICNFFIQHQITYLLLKS